MDQLADVQSQVDTGYFNGQGQTFEVAGNILPPDNCIIENATFIQLDPAVSRRTIYKNGGTGLRLHNVKVDRGSWLTYGTLSGSAGIWIASTSNVDLDKIEVTGHGLGSGVALHSLQSPRLGDIYVHDMRYSEASDPGSERVIGIWLNGCIRFTLDKPIVSRLDGEIGGVLRAYQTDGISISGCSDFSIIGAQVGICGEGIDITGSIGNSRFSVIGGNIHNIDSFGLKLANTASIGMIQGVTAMNCGYSGFVMGGASEQNIPNEEYIRLIGCQSVNAGSNGRWASYTTAGFSIMQGAYAPDYPQNVRLIDCLAIDWQATKTMKFGYRNENNSTTNRLINCQSVGHSIASVSGNFG